MRLALAFLTAFAFLSPPSVADIQGLHVSVATAVDGVIDRWTVFRDGPKVWYFRCTDDVDVCTRQSPEGSVAERRSVPYEEWIAVVAKSYQLEGTVLANSKANRRRVDATIKALNALIGSGPDATDEERKTAETKLAGLTAKGGYRDRLGQAESLAAAVEPSETPLVVEAADLRAFRARYPFNFDFTGVATTATTVRMFDVASGLEWIVPRDVQATLFDAEAACEALDARLPTAEEAKAAADWWIASPLAKALARVPSPDDVVVGPWFWLNRSSAQALRIESKSGSGYYSSPTPTISGSYMRAYHSWEGHLALFDVHDGGKVQKIRRKERILPTIQRDGSYEERVVDPSTEEILSLTEKSVGRGGVACVR